MVISICVWPGQCDHILYTMLSCKQHFFHTQGISNIIFNCYPRAARWPRSDHTLSIQIFCKNYGSVWRVPSIITALSSDYNSYCHSNSSYATSPRPIRAYIYTIYSIATMCIRKENIASSTCLMTYYYSHELQLYRNSPMEAKTTVYACR